MQLINIHVASTEKAPEWGKRIHVRDGAPPMAELTVPGTSREVATPARWEPQLSST